MHPSARTSPPARLPFSGSAPSTTTVPPFPPFPSPRKGPPATPRAWPRGALLLSSPPAPDSALALAVGRRALLAVPYLLRLPDCAGLPCCCPARARAWACAAAGTIDACCGAPAPGLSRLTTARLPSMRPPPPARPATPRAPPRPARPLLRARTRKRRGRRRQMHQFRVRPSPSSGVTEPAPPYPTSMRPPPSAAPSARAHLPVPRASLPHCVPPPPPAGPLVRTRVHPSHLTAAARVSLPPHLHLTMTLPLPPADGSS